MTQEQWNQIVDGAPEGLRPVLRQYEGYLRDKLAEQGALTDERIEELVKDADNSRNETWTDSIRRILRSLRLTPAPAAPTLPLEKDRVMTVNYKIACNHRWCYKEGRDGLVCVWCGISKWHSIIAPSVSSKQEQQAVVEEIKKMVWLPQSQYPGVDEARNGLVYEVLAVARRGWSEDATFQSALKDQLRGMVSIAAVEVLIDDVDRAGYDVKTLREFRRLFRAVTAQPPAKPTKQEPIEIIYREADANSFHPRVCGLCGAWVIDQLAHTGWHNNLMAIMHLTTPAIKSTFESWRAQKNPVKT
jgi:hypothetical protein